MLAGFFIMQIPDKSNKPSQQETELKSIEDSVHYYEDGM